LVEPVDSPFFVNARVQRCWVDKVHFRDVVFVNCDFRMTRFNQCVFENVQFVNSLMDGTLLDRCQIVGAPSHRKLSQVLDDSAREAVYAGGVPEFWAPGREALDVVAALSYFRGEKLTPSLALYSLTSGVSVLAAPTEAILKTDAGQMVSLGGGLAILGGRMSNFMARSCVFATDATGRDGEMAIAYTAGSSVDFVEQNELALYVLGSAIRGFSVSRPRREVTNALPPGAIRVRTRKTLLAGPWFSEGLRGSIEMVESMLWGEANLSDVPVDGAPSAFVIAGDDLQTEADLASLSAGEWAERNQLRSRLPEKTDYRSSAAEYELQRRVMGAPSTE
jgi:hypothetical protein